MRSYRSSAFMMMALMLTGQLRTQVSKASVIGSTVPEATVVVPASLIIRESSVYA